MNPDATQQPPGSGQHAAVDADAVCEVCNTVNTDGTLLCRNCGNNLRDQKLRRLQGEVPVETGEGLSVRTIVRGVVGVVGLLAILWFAIAGERIADSLVSGGAAAAPHTRHFSAANSAEFEQLAARVNAIVPTNEAIARAQENPPAGIVDGDYVLVSDDIYAPLQILGTAAIQQDGDRFLFLATLRSGEEMRGVAYAQGQSALRAAWDDMAVRTSEGAIVAASGVAVSQQDGSIECFGQYALDDVSYGAIAYRLVP